MLLGYFMRDNQARSIITAGKKLDNYLILLTECLAVREATIMAFQNEKPSLRVIHS